MAKTPIPRPTPVSPPPEDEFGDGDGFDEALGSLGGKLALEDHPGEVEFGQPEDEPVSLHPRTKAEQEAGRRHLEAVNAEIEARKKAASEAE